MKRRDNVFEQFSHHVTASTGSTPAFIIALGVILARDDRVTRSHSIEEAEARHARKLRVKKARRSDAPAAGGD